MLGKVIKKCNHGTVNEAEHCRRLFTTIDKWVTFQTNTIIPSINVWGKGGTWQHEALSALLSGSSVYAQPVSYDWDLHKLHSLLDLRDSNSSILRQHTEEQTESMFWEQPNLELQLQKVIKQLRSDPIYKCSRNSIFNSLPVPRAVLSLIIYGLEINIIPMFCDAYRSAYSFTYATTNTNSTILPKQNLSYVKHTLPLSFQAERDLLIISVEMGFGVVKASVGQSCHVRFCIWNAKKKHYFNHWNTISLSAAKFNKSRNSADQRRTLTVTRGLHNSFQTSGLVEFLYPFVFTCNRGIGNGKINWHKIQNIFLSPNSKAGAVRFPRADGE